MHLKHLEVSGFKSFAKPIRMEFSAPVSAVVGPNGSGKSNVVEALRWVLGEQSMKSLRGKKGEDLIFNGSQTAPRLGKAMVTITFDNKSKAFPIDYDEVKISRKIFRDGTGEYMINGSKVRLKDIIELLSKVGLGSTSHHIIRQGEADRILNTSNKERRQMIEDALGLKIYQIKKIESERKLLKTEENIGQVETLKKEIQPHLKFLKKQVEKAENNLSLREELRGLYNEYLCKENYQLENALRKFASEKDGPTVEFESINKKLSERVEDTRSIQIKKEISELRESLSGKKTEINEVRSKRGQFERELGRFEGMIEMEEERRIKFNHVTVPFNSVKDFTNKLTGLVAGESPETGIVGLKKIIYEIRETTKSFISRLNLGFEFNTAELDNLKHKKEDTVNILDKLKEKEDALLRECSNVETQIRTKEESIRALEKEGYEMEARSKELGGILEGLKIKEENLNSQKEEFNRNYQDAKDMFGETVFINQSVADAQWGMEERGRNRARMNHLKIRLEETDDSSEDIIKEYDDVKQRDEFFGKELEDLKTASMSLRDLLKQLEKKIDSDFQEGIEKINKEFQIFFEAMFGGGHAELKMSKVKLRKKEIEEGEIEENLDTGESVEEGVDVSINLPRKRISSLDMLSGGERALSSIALLFAISQVNPPPFLVLDETDAALDEANSQRYGNMIKALSKHTQLIIITHNRETMKQAGILYGVTMGADSISKLLSIKFEQAEMYAA